MLGRHDGILHTQMYQQERQAIGEYQERGVSAFLLGQLQVSHPEQPCQADSGLLTAALDEVVRSLSTSQNSSLLLAYEQAAILRITPVSPASGMFVSQLNRLQQLLSACLRQKQSFHQVIPVCALGPASSLPAWAWCSNSIGLDAYSRSKASEKAIDALA